MGAFTAALVPCFECTSPLQHVAKRHLVLAMPSLTLQHPKESPSMQSVPSVGGLARPDRAMYRLIRKGALHPRKIAGHFAFDKRELEIVAANGDQKRGRGRPRKHNS